VRLEEGDAAEPDPSMHNLPCFSAARDKKPTLAQPGCLRRVYALGV
jgi:hypothetical protein